MYGCETWRIIKSTLDRLQSFTNRCLRYILRLRWQAMTTNEELLRRTGQERVYIYIKWRKWGWLGHTLRKPPACIAHHALRWNPQGTRKRGRPKTTWKRATEAEGKTVGYSWGQLETAAQDRDRWRILVGDLCSTRSDKA